MPRLLRLSLRLVFVIALLLAFAVLAGWWALRGSLAPLDGGLDLAGLSAPVSVERDDNGAVTIRAQNEADAIRALGLVHAQERYFEMDLLRRSAAGELSALFGAIAVERDKQARVHRLRARLLASPGEYLGEREAVARAYLDGVNAGLASLRVRPWPYLLLRTAPEPWRIEDTGLVAFAMFMDLQDENNTRELALWRLRERLPAPLFALLSHDGSTWDAPLAGTARGDAALPDAAMVDLRDLPSPATRTAALYREPDAPGSNNWAVSGAVTGDGRAIVADDMHLGHGAPNIWFRVRLVYPDARAPGGQVDIAGVSLPGLPGVVVGSNGHVAWGFTNSYGDWHDWVRVAHTGDGRYRTPEGEAAIEIHRETIAVKGGAPVHLDVRETRWGPILHELDDGASLALAWTAHRPGAVNLGLMDLAHAGDLDAAAAIADGAGIPPQNLIAGDRHGRIGWKLIGRIPDRRGDCDPRLPLDPLAGCDWQGWLAQTPQRLDPAEHRLWSANARVADGEALRLIGDGGYALGARQQQIRDALFARERFAEADLLAIQLDDRAVFLQRWHTLLQEQASAAPEDDALARLASAARTWEGRAATDAVGYRLVRAWRLAVLDRIAKGLVAPVAAADALPAPPSLPQLEGVAWPLVAQRPAHLLPAQFGNWDALFADAAAQVTTQLEATGPLTERRWGEQNTARICHPLAAALPQFIRPHLCMPGDELPGDSHMPRVQGATFGASQRMVVAPGHEADGYLHMPGGQSGHPLSPFWGAGHGDWVKGERSPFLPGAPLHTLTLAPRRSR